MLRDVYKYMPIAKRDMVVYVEGCVASCREECAVMWKLDRFPEHTS